jgi:hypothetical protein
VNAPLRSRSSENVHVRTTMEHQTYGALFWLGARAVVRVSRRCPGRQSDRKGAPRRAWVRRSAVLLSTVLVVLSSTDRASAAAGQWHAGGRAGIAWLDGPRYGPAAEAFLRHGITDALDLDVQVMTSLHPFQPDAKMAPDSGRTTSGLPSLLGITPGLLYRWDVLRAIPFAGAGVGAFAGDGLSSRWSGFQFGASARAGVEWLLNRDVVLSVQASAHVALTDSAVPAPWVLLTAGAGYVWGW